jgi:hypothetical protein
VVLWLVMNIMSKRSPDRTILTPHPLKHAKKDNQTLSPVQMIPDFELQEFYESLRRRLETQDTDQILDWVYDSIRSLIRRTKKSNHDHNITLASENQFRENVDKGRFLEAMRTAANHPLNREALEAMIFHSMCLCFGTDQIMNIIQVHFGRLHPSLSVRL